MSRLQTFMEDHKLLWKITNFCGTFQTFVKDTNCCGRLQAFVEDYKLLRTITNICGNYKLLWKIKGFCGRLQFFVEDYHLFLKKKEKNFFGRL